MWAIFTTPSCLTLESRLGIKIYIIWNLEVLPVGPGVSYLRLLAKGKELKVTDFSLPFGDQSP
jgi:hypothetical protein